MDASPALTREDVLLGRLLVDAEFLSHDQLYDCVELQKMYGDGRPIGSIFLEMGYLTEDELGALLAIQAEYLEALELQAFLESDVAPLAEAPPEPEPPPAPKRKAKKTKSVPAPPPEPVAEPAPAPAEAVPEPAAPISEYYTYKVKAIRAKPMRDGRHALAVPGDWLSYLLEKAIAVAVVGMALVMVLLVVLFVRNRFATEPEDATPQPRTVRPANRPPPRNAPPPANRPAHETRPPQPANTHEAEARPVEDRFGALAGVVLAPEGAPIAGVAVTITDPDGGGMGSTSDADGGFRLDHLPPGSFTVSVQDAQNRGKIPADGYEDRKVEVEAGRTARVRFGGPPEAGAAVVGAVLEEGRAVPGAFITLVYLGGGGGDPGAGMDTKNATTDERGEFRFAGLPSGSYSLLATHPTDPARTARAMIDLSEGGERRRDLRFSRLLLRGRAIDGKSSTPLPGVSVFLQKEEDGGESARVLETLVSQQVMSSFTDESGRFEFTSLEPGTYTAVASVEGYAIRAVGRIEVGADGGAREIEIPLVSGGGVLEGAVKKKSGDIPPNTYVAVRDAANHVISLRRVGRTGEFEVDGLAPGAYRAVIFCEGQDGQVRFFTVASDGVMSQEFEIP